MKQHIIKDYKLKVEYDFSNLEAIFIPSSNSKYLDSILNEIIYNMFTREEYFELLSNDEENPDRNTPSYKTAINGLYVNVLKL